jgi:hypothetical protein
MTSATFSQELAGGVSPCDELGGRTPARFGQVLARANLSARQAKELGLLMSGIYGRHSSTSSASAALASSLGSRLQAAQDLNGSPEYALTWKVRDTERRGQIYALQGSLRPTSDSDFSGLPTPTVNSILEASCPAADGRVRVLPSGALRKRSKKGIEGSMNWSQWVLAKGWLPTPKLALFFMGYPERWALCAERAMLSCRKSPKNS